MHIYVGFLQALLHHFPPARAVCRCPQQTRSGAIPQTPGSSPLKDRNIHPRRRGRVVLLFLHRRRAPLLFIRTGLGSPQPSHGLQSVYIDS